MNNYLLIVLIIFIALISMHLEDRYTFIKKLSGCVTALFIMMILSSTNVVPSESPVYDFVWDYIVPLSISMFLFKSDIKSIYKKSGRLIIIYLISSIGTLLGAFLSYYFLKDHIKDIEKIIPMFTATYIGGSINFIAMADYYKVGKDILGAGFVADNLLMALYFFVLMAAISSKFLLRIYRHPYIKNADKNCVQKKSVNKKKKFMKNIDLKDVLTVIFISSFLVILSIKISEYFSNILADGTFFEKIIKALLSSKYILITFFSVLISSIFSDYIKNLRSNEYMGRFLIYIFFTVIGGPASIIMIVKKSPLLLLLALIIVSVNLFFSFILGKIFRFSIEEIVIASNANIGGPTTAASMAASKKWEELVVPAILVGTLGYIVGNLYGIFIGTLIS